MVRNIMGGICYFYFKGKEIGFREGKWFVCNYRIGRVGMGMC